VLTIELTTDIIILLAVVTVFTAILAFYIGMSYRKKVAERTIGNAEEKSNKIIDDAIKNAESKKKEIVLEAKEDALKTKNEIDLEVKERRLEIQNLEKRVVQKEEVLDKKSASLDLREEKLLNKTEEAEKMKEEASKAQNKVIEELERISGYTRDEAKDQLLRNLEDELKHESVKLIKEMETKTKEEADKKAKKIIVEAIQRYAADHVAENAVTVVPLPNDEMKGRIIGREGRNIRTLETLTGMELIIDDTPEAVVLSGFNPVRREIARIALEKLIADGRIHPARIEEMVEKATEEVEKVMKEEGENATFDVGVHGLDSTIVRLIGKLKYRTSYGQNILKHSVEVAHLCGTIAAELGLDITKAKRAGLLHDIGKALDQDTEGSHVSLGVDLLKKHGEAKDIINAVEAHHGDVEPETMYAVIVQAADAISAARPGARRETLETYIKRLQKLEEIANEFDGVEKSFAIQAGRELRIAVVPEKVSEADAILMARKVAEKIESELEYPGQIKVSLIRETRTVDYAK
jgi:ribonuclease Y